MKDAAILNAAYDDAAGVTAEFNLNLLTRINRELGGNFDRRPSPTGAFYQPRAQPRSKCTSSAAGRRR